MPSVTASRLIAAAPEDVWGVIADIENARRWNEHWSRIEITSTQRHGDGMTFRTYQDDGSRFDFEVTAWDPPYLIIFAPVRAEEEKEYAINLESQMFELVPAGNGETEVRVTARAFTHGWRGFLIGRIFWPGHQKQGLTAALDALAAVFEPEQEKELEGVEDDEPAIED